MNFHNGEAVTVGTNIYLFGGYPNYTYAYKYDTNTDTYTVLTNIPYNFNAVSAVAVGTDIYLFGGANSSAIKTYAYKYNTSTNTYIQLDDIPNSFSSGDSAFNGVDIYLLGGSSFPTKVQVMSIVPNEYANKSIVLAQNKADRYETKLVNTTVSNGLRYTFNDAFYFENSKFDLTIPTYYGDGEKWAKIRN